MLKFQYFGVVNQEMELTTLKALVKSMWNPLCSCLLKGPIYERSHDNKIRNTSYDCVAYVYSIYNVI